MFVSMIGVVVLFLFWAFFAGSETAFVSSNRFQLANMKKRGNRSAKTAAYLLEKPERLLSTSLVGTNLTLVLSSNLIASMFRDYFGQPKPLLSILTITLLSLIFCEVLPKNVAMVRNRSWTLLSALPMFVFFIIFYPVGKIFSFLTWVVIRILGIPHTSLLQGLFKRKEDVKFFISAHLQAQFSEIERRYFQDTLDFGEKKLSDIMVPLVEIVAVPDTAKIRDCHLFIEEHKKQIIPVYSDRIDNIIGVLTARELLAKDKNSPVVDNMKEAVFVPESINISKLYREAYVKGYLTMFAVDEYGGTTGLATIYDIGEEIIGRFDIPGELGIFVKISENEFLCDGDAEIDEISRTLGTAIEHEDFSTINGLFLQDLGKIPEAGDTIRVGGYCFSVEKSSRKKAELIRITKEK